MAADEQKSSISIVPLKPLPHLELRDAVRFGLYEADLRHGVLRKQGLRIRLPNQSFQILSALLSRPGEVISRDELRLRLWSNDVYVDFDRSLNTAVRKLRSALRDSSRKPRYIETLPRQGYRFIAETDCAVSNVHVPACNTLPAAAIDDLIASTQVPSSGSLGTAANHTRQKVWRRYLMPAALGCTLVFALASRVQRAPKAVAPPVPNSLNQQIIVQQDSIALLGFRNSSRSAQASWLSTAMSEMLSTEMTADGHLRLVPAEVVTRAKLELSLLQEDTYAPDTLARIYKNLGCDYVVAGSYLALGKPEKGRVRLDARVQNAKTGQVVGSVAVTGSQSNLFELVSQAGEQLRTQMGLGPAPTDVDEVRAALPSGSEAARLYTEALNNQRAFNTLTARDLLEEVTRLQPQYAPAYSALASAWSALGYDTNARAAAKKAMELSRQMPRRVRLESEARYYELSGNWDQAAMSYSQLRHLYPNSLSYGLFLANAESNLGRNTDALRTIAELRKLSWSEREFANIDLEQATIAGVMSDWKTEQKLAERAAERASRSNAVLLMARAKLVEGLALRMLGEFAEAKDAFRTAEKIFLSYGDIDQAGVAVMNAGQVAYRESNLQLAKSLLTKAQTAFQQVGDESNLAVVLANLANIYSDHGDLPVAERLNRRCLQIFAQTGHQSSQDGVAYNLAETLQEEGKLQEAEQLLLGTVGHLRISGEKGLLGYTLGLLGLIREARGDMTQALQLLDEAVQLLNETGDKLSAADTEQYLAIFQFRHGDPVQAKKTLSQAMKTDEQTGAKSQIAFDNVIGAELALEQGLPADPALLRDAIQELQQEHLLTPEIQAEIALSRELLREGRIVDAHRLATHANSLTREEHDPMAKVQAAVAMARIATAENNFGHAESILREALTRAETIGCVRCEWQVQLELGKLNCQSGDLERGRRRLQNVANDAQRKGYQWIARLSLDAQKSSETR